MIEYKGVNFKENSEMIIWYLRQSEGFESAKSITQALSKYNGISKHIVRQNLRKFESENMVELKYIPQNNIKDKKLYKIYESSVQDYLSVKEEKGYNNELYKPVSDESDKIDMMMDKMEDLIIENNNKSRVINKMHKRLDAQEDLINHQQKKIEELESRLDNIEKFNHEVKHRMKK